MGRSPKPQKTPLTRLVIMIDQDTKGRIANAANAPKFKGNMSQWAIEAILEQLTREEGMEL